MFLIFLGLLMLFMCDYLIRNAEDSKIKRVWIKTIKKPLIKTIVEKIEKLEHQLEKKYGKHPKNSDIFNYGSMLEDVSKRYTYKIIYIALLVILLGILYNVLILFK